MVRVSLSLSPSKGTTSASSIGGRPKTRPYAAVIQLNGVYMYIRDIVVMRFFFWRGWVEREYICRVIHIYTRVLASVWVYG